MKLCKVCLLLDTDWRATVCPLITSNVARLMLRPKTAQLKATVGENKEKKRWTRSKSKIDLLIFVLFYIHAYIHIYMAWSERNVCIWLYMYKAVILCHACTRLHNVSLIMVESVSMRCPERKLALSATIAVEDNPSSTWDNSSSHPERKTHHAVKSCQKVFAFSHLAVTVVSTLITGICQACPERWKAMIGP